jgi:transposase
VPPRADASPVRCVGACTVELEALADGRATGDMTTVARDSTGGSWLPLVALRATRGFEVLRVDPQQGQTITGRPQSAGPDGPWWQRLHTCGLLAGACRPPDQVCVLRRDGRPRGLLWTSASQPSQHRQTALPQMHLKRPQVVSDITGRTGRAMIRALLGGARAPVQVAKLRHERCQHDAAAIAQARHGQGRAEHRFARAQAVAWSDV